MFVPLGGAQTWRPQPSRAAIIMSRNEKDSKLKCALVTK